MNKKYNVEIQERLEKFLKDEGLSQAKAAPILGISQGVLSQYRRSIYDKGDIIAIEKQLEEFFRIKDEKKENDRKAKPFKGRVGGGYIPTSISEGTYKAIRYCQLEKGIVVNGDAGIGKTKGAAKFLQDNPTTAVYVKASPSTSSVRSLLKMIARALKMPDNQRTEDLSVVIQEKLKQTDKVIIIDEAQNLKFLALEEIRGWVDEDPFTGKPGIGIVLIGNEEVYNKMLGNEKYKGDAILQKSYTTDFLTKKRAMNQGEIQMFYIEDDHEPIIEPWIWECVQLEIVRRKKYMEEHGTNSYSHYTEQNPFAARIVCGNCNKVFTRKGWQSRNGDIRRVWQCSERYKVKGVMGCSNRHVEEATLLKVFIQAWNALLENREQAVAEWEETMNGDDLLEKYRAKDFMKLMEKAQPIEKLDTDLMLRVLDHIKVYEEGMLAVVFLDGTEIEYKVE